MAPRRSRAPPFRTLAELEGVAARATPSAVWEYVRSGAGAERTLRANERAFDRWALVPRILRDVRSVDLTTRFLGDRVAAPFFAAPTAYQGSIGAGGERSTARAFSRAGLLGVFSTLSSRSLEEIARAGRGSPRWFQLYLQPDEDRSVELVARAEEAGFSALVWTVDAPILGSRDVQSRRGFALDQPVPLGNGPQVRTPGRGTVRRGDRHVVDEVPEYSWGTLDRLRRSSKLPLIVKGILDPEDARLAVRHGARGIVVSNHGGRQLDRSIPALQALPGIVAAVGRDAEVYLDGGVRRGADILIALALGARGVGLGRPVLWALAAGGEAGVTRLIELLSSELATSLVLLGRDAVARVDRSTVVPATGDLRGEA